VLIGLIGAGRVAQAFAKYSLEAGHQVILSNSRGPTSLKQLVEELGDGASAGTVEDAAKAEVVVLAVQWSNLEAALNGLPNWEGRILIDSTNQFIGEKGELATLDGRGSSEYIAALVPGARVVKAVNNLFAKNFAAGPSLGGGKRITFVSGDDPDAKKKVSDLLSTFGFAAIDLGPLHAGGIVQQAGGPLAGLDLVKF
jgi:8-hydroxy-5-deazaflavin:NADPH oxidoreductase